MITKKVTIAVIINVKKGPAVIHRKPVRLLATNAQMLCNPVYVPIAVAVSLRITILLIHAFEMPSVAEAYIPYRKNNAKNT